MFLTWVSIIFVRFTYHSKRKYNAVYLKYRCRWAFIVGITLCSLTMVCIVSFIQLQTTDSDHGMDSYKCNAETRIDSFYVNKIDESLTWVEFIAFILPPLALIAAWLPQDLFEVYNKYPELGSRVSLV